MRKTIAYFSNLTFYIKFFSTKAFGSLVYAATLLFYVSPDQFSLQMPYLLLQELFFGMIFFPLKTSAMRSILRILDFSFWAFIFSCIGCIYAFIALVYNFHFILLLLSLALFPVIVFVSACSEHEHVDEFIEKENYCALAGVLSAGALFSLLYSLAFMEYASLLFRVIFSQIFLLSFSKKTRLFQVSWRIPPRIKIQNAIPGIEYLVALYFFKSSVFSALININPHFLGNPREIIKYFTTFYDPIAAVCGLILRRVYGLNPINNFIKTTKKKIFLIAALPVSGFSSFFIIEEKIILMINVFSFVALFISFSAMTTAMVLSKFSVRCLSVAVFYLCAAIIIFNSLFYQFIFIIPLIIYLIIYYPRVEESSLEEKIR